MPDYLDNVRKDGNFWFIKDYDELYKNVLGVEKNLWINLIHSAREIRTVLNTYLALNGTIVELGKEQNRESRIQRIDNTQGIFIDDTSYTLDRTDGIIEEKGCRAAKFLVTISDAYHHDEKDAPNLAMYRVQANVEKALEILHKELCWWNSKQCEKQRQPEPNYGSFQLAYMPISDWFIINPINTGSKDIKKFLASQKSGGYKYGIVYLYENVSQTTNEVFKIRQERVQSLHKAEFPNFMSAPKDSDSLFYAFTFVKKPENLKDYLKNGTVTSTQKKQICYQLADVLNRLQKKTPKIFHRALKASSIFMDADELSTDGEKIPRIVDFYFAKVTEDDTVFDEFSNMSGKDCKYAPPEKNTVTISTTDEEWGRYDVFSLGRIFIDILDNMGDPGGIVSIKKNCRDLIKKRGKCEDFDEVFGEDFRGKDFWDFINKMLAKENKERPTMAAVVERLKPDINQAPADTVR
jgi:serine/threonine protein kinase